MFLNYTTEFTECEKVPYVILKVKVAFQEPRTLYL